MENYIRDLKGVMAEAKDEHKDPLLALLSELEELEREIHMDCYDTRVERQRISYWKHETSLDRIKTIVGRLEVLKERVGHFEEAVDFVLERAMEEQIVEQDKALKAKERSK